METGKNNERVLRVTFSMISQTDTKQTRHSYQIALCLITLLGLFLRITNIQILDPFVDESGNVLVANSPGFASIVDPVEQGRPLLQWLFKPAMWLAQSLGPDWFIWSARYQTALIGAITALLASLLTLSTLGPQAAFLVAALLNTQPLFVIHDRLALQDPYTSFFIISALWFGKLAVQVPARFSVTWILVHVGLGVSLGLAFTNKITALGPIAWAPCVVCALTRIPARLVLRTFFLGGIFSVPVILTLAPKPWRLGSGLLSSHHVPWHIPLASHSSMPSLSMWDQILFSLRGIDFLISTLLNFTSLGYVVILLGALIVCFRSKEHFAWAAGILLLSVFNLVAYHSIAYSRYFHVDGIFLSLFIAAMYRMYVGRRSASQEQRLPALLLLATITVIATLGGAIKTVEAVRFPTDEDVLQNTDYQNYSRNKHSGYGTRDFLSALSSHLATRPKPTTVFTEASFSPLTNALALYYAFQSDVSIRVGDGKDVKFPAIALYYLRANGGEQATFFLARDKQSLQSPLDLSHAGITCDLAHSTPRLCTNCTFELLECRVVDAAQIYRTLPTQERPRTAGYVGPRLRVVPPAGKNKICLTISLPPELRTPSPNLAIRNSTTTIPLQETATDSGDLRRCGEIPDASGGDVEIVANRWVVLLERPSPSLFWGGTPYVASYRLDSIEFLSSDNHE